MEEFIKFLTNANDTLATIVALKPRVSNSIGSVVKVLDAALTVDLGDNEKAVITGLSGIAHKLQDLAA